MMSVGESFFAYPVGFSDGVISFLLPSRSMIADSCFALVLSM
jgi:hypothetical protein